MKYFALLAFTSFPFAAWSDAAVIEAVQARGSNGAWNFAVTLSHPDSGWEHYADGWEVLAPDGVRLGHRELLHPHVNEQPFTRSLGGVAIADNIDHITIRAKCSVDGWVGGEFEVPLVR